MMTSTALNEACNTLLGAVERLKALGADLALPQEEYSLSEAMAKLGAVVPKSHRVTLDVWSLSGKSDVEWKVWDGDRHFEAKTLTAAVNACLAAHGPEPEDPLEEAQTVLAEAAVPAKVEQRLEALAAHSRPGF